MKHILKIATQKIVRYLYFVVDDDDYDDIPKFPQHKMYISYNNETTCHTVCAASYANQKLSVTPLFSIWYTNLRKYLCTYHTYTTTTTTK